MKKSITVNAPRTKVWNAIMSYRSSEPDKRKVISSDAEKTVIEEKFPGLPMLGSSRVVYAEYCKEPERIDYKLVESDKLNKFEGHWALEETDGGKATNVELTGELDIAVVLPFKEKVLESQAEVDMKKRLNYVKRTAEAEA